MRKMPRRLRNAPTTPAWTGLALAACGLATIACWWQIRALGDLRTQLPAFGVWFGLAFALYLAGLWLVRRWPAGGGTAGALTVLLLSAAVARAVMLTSPPTLSNDIERYRWDGRVQLAGFDPYAHAPDAPELAALREATPLDINFPHLRTVYPPVAQLGFRLGALIGPSFEAQKAIVLAAESLLVLALLGLLWQWRLSPLWIAAYAWHPLTILEFAGSGHNDAFALAFLWIGVAAWTARRWLGATLGWSAAFLSKFVSALLLPWWWRQREGRRCLAVFGILSLLPFLVQPSAASALVETLGGVAHRVESNAGGFLLLLGLLRHPPLAYLAAGALGVIWLLWWARRHADPTRFLLGAIAGLALLSPAVHPWYLVWLVPCFCFWRVPALLLWTGTIVLAYAVWPGYLAQGIWELPAWARAAEYAPVIVLGVWSLAQCVWRSSFRLATKPSLSARS